MNSLDTMCQGARLMGMSQRDERNLESYFRKLSSENGSEFLISKLKVLKEQTIRQLEDPSYSYKHEDGEPSFSWRRDYDSPKGPMSVIYKTWRKPESRVRGIGMLINTILEDQVTDKQLNKLLKGVNSDSRDDDGKVIDIDPKTARLFVTGFERSRKSLPVFSGLDLTGTLIPYGNYSESIAEAKRNLCSSDSDRRHKAIAQLSHAVDGEWIDCPPIVTDYLRKEVPSYKDRKLRRSKGQIARDYEYSYKYKTYGRHINDYYAGTASFLQKPGGKLRTVYNTNRVINTAMTPYACGLENAFYNQFPHEIFVERQEKGWSTIQQMLKRGHKLTSADLTSATDYLNPRPFYNGLRQAIVELADSDIDYDISPGSENIEETERFLSQIEASLDFMEVRSEAISNPCHEKFVQLADNLEKVIDVGLAPKSSLKYVHALRGINLFERVAEMPFYSKDLDNAIGLRSGQPLGMMGSFQTLTAMNFMAGRIACEETHGRFDSEIPQFAVVGDDFVGDESIMDRYSKTIQSWGGVDNHEKALKSDRYAEFCSHLITRDKVIPMKPKFQLGHNSVWLNSGKTSLNKTLHVYRLNEEDKQALNTLAMIGDPRETFMGSIGTDARLSQEDRLIIESALRSLSLFDEAKSESVDISNETSRLSRIETNLDSQYEGTELDRRIFHESEDGKVYTGLARFSYDHEDDHFTTAVDQYDHRKAERQPRKSLRQTNEEIHQKALLAKDLLSVFKGDYSANKQHRLPGHKSSSISNEELLLQGMQLQDRQGEDMEANESPFPSVRSNRSRTNLVDRSRVDKANGLDPSLLDMTNKQMSSSASSKTDNLGKGLTDSLKELGKSEKKIDRLSQS